MSRFRIPTAGELLVGIMLGVLFHFPIALLGNAVTGWVDSAIAEHFNLTSPSINTVVSFLLQWVAPFAAAFVVMVTYHYFNSKPPTTAATTPSTAMAPARGSVQPAPHYIETAGPFEWNWQNLIFTNSADVDGDPVIYVISVNIEGRNISDNEIVLRKVYLISSLSGDRREMEIGTSTGQTSVDQINPIPPQAGFQFTAQFHQGGLANQMTDAQFLKKWGIFRFIVEYDDTGKFSKVFDTHAINECLDRIRAVLLVLNPKREPQPRVTRRI